MQNIKLKISDTQTANYRTLNTSNDSVAHTIVTDQGTPRDIKKNQTSVDSHLKSPRLASYIPRGIFGCLVMK